MQIHELKPKTKFKAKKRIGRGGKRGTYSGRGMKGQKSRSGHGVARVTERGRSSWIKRLPKLGGFSSVYLPNRLVKTSQLEAKFKAGDEVNAKSLKEAGLIGSGKRGKSGKKQLIKILNDAPLTKKLVISGCLVSAKVKAMVEKSGGEVKTVPVRKKKQEKKKTQPKKG